MVSSVSGLFYACIPVHVSLRGEGFVGECHCSWLYVSAWISRPEGRGSVASFKEQLQKQQEAKKYSEEKVKEFVEARAGEYESRTSAKRSLKK